MIGIPPLPQPRETQLCECGQMLLIEMEFDHGSCVECQSRDAILSGRALKHARVDRVIERALSSFKRITV